MVDTFGPNVSNVQVSHAYQFLNQLAYREVFRIYALSGQNKIILGGFIMITIIQALTGILLTAIPSSSSELSFISGRLYQSTYGSYSCEISVNPAGRIPDLRFRHEGRP